MGPLSREPSKEETLRKFLQAKNVNCDKKRAEDEQLGAARRGRLQFRETSIDKKSAKNTVASEELPNSNTEQPAKLKTKKKTNQRQIRKRHESGRSSSSSSSSSANTRSRSSSTSVN